MTGSRTQRRRSEQSRTARARRRRLARLLLFALSAAAVLFIWHTIQPESIEPTDNRHETEEARESRNHAGAASKPEAGPSAREPMGRERAPGDGHSTESSAPPSLSEGNKRPETDVTLSFVGDVMWAGNVWRVMETNGHDYPYRHVKSYLQKADIAVANFESPITDRGEAEEKEYAFRSSPKALPHFKEAGFDLVNLANNHILDYGMQGLMDTFDSLDKAGIRRVGAGRDAEEAYGAVVMEAKGVKIAFLGFSRVVPSQSWKAGENGIGPGVAHTYSTKVPIESIRKARESADLVVVIAHWGIEREDRPAAYQTDLAHAYIDAGADLVIGGHPHVLQGFEQYKGKWIAYSLGNFIFTMNPNPVTWESMILEASCGKSGDCALRVVPVLTKLGNPEPMKAPENEKLLDRLSSISINAEIDESGYVRKTTKTRYPKEDTVNHPVDSSTS